MRTTIELPDELMRRVKSAAALRGMKLKEFVAHLLEQGIGSAEPTPKRTARKLPEMIKSAGRNIPNRTNAEWFDLIEREDG